ncbi:MAG: alpha/beta hydrolase [Actinobacteria bacterium]|nr:MAG: alpha/beta hydrolase [Actinomycetota bacterium]
MDIPDPDQFELADGRRVDVYLAGPDDGVLLISHHGTPASGIPVSSFVQAAAERGLRWVSYSRPGYGDSGRLADRTVADCAEDVVAIADHLGAERFFTIGASGGGPHTLACAARLPERVLGCAAIACPAPWGAEGLDWLAGQGPENIAEWEATLAGPTELERFLAKEAGSVGAATSPQDLIDAIGGLLPDVDRAALTGAFADTLLASGRRAVSNGIWGWFDDDFAFTRDWGFALSEIAVPVALWQGGEDRMVPFAHGEWLSAHVAGVRAHLTDGDGHLSLAVSSLPKILDDLLEHATR